MRRVSVVAYVGALVLFGLAGLGVDVGSLSELDLVAFGLAAFALGHIAPQSRVRALAFSMLASAAFDLPLPFLDRLGSAALGLAFLALSIGAAVPRPRRARPFPVPPKTVALPELADERAAGLLDRLGRYGEPEPSA